LGQKGLRRSPLGRHRTQSGLNKQGESESLSQFLKKI